MPEKILVVDDEHEIADLIEVYLSNENYVVFKFYSAKEALACIDTAELAGYHAAGPGRIHGLPAYLGSTHLPGYYVDSQGR